MTETTETPHDNASAGGNENGAKHHAGDPSTTTPPTTTPIPTQTQTQTTTATQTTTQATKVPVGIHGVRLKRFETVVAKLLSAVEPSYVSLPPPPASLLPASTKTQRAVDGNDNDNDNDTGNDDIRIRNDTESDWLFSALPESARVVGNRHPNRKRAQKKEGQLRSMLRCILPLVPPSSSHSKSDSKSNSNSNSNSNSASPTTRSDRPVTIVDFGGGSGHLGIPLALLLPHCRVIVVDFNERSIDLLHEKAEGIIREAEATTANAKNNSGIDASRFAATTPPLEAETAASYRLRCCGGASPTRVLDNLFTFAGPVEDFGIAARESDSDASADVAVTVDVVLALHLCGEATDVGLRKAVANQAASIVVAPCCVGKLSASVFNPDIYHATGQNQPTVRYPQSELFCRLLNHRGSDPPNERKTNGKTKTNGTGNPNRNKNDKNPTGTTEDDWNALAKAADYSNEHEFRTSRNASRRTAKALLETDRRLFLEGHGYRTALTKMEPLEVTPKNDILVAWRPSAFCRLPTSPGALFCEPNQECLADLAVARSHLLGARHTAAPAASTSTSTSASSGFAADDTRSGNTPASARNGNPKHSEGIRNDWTETEEEEIKATIVAFLERTDTDTNAHCGGGGGETANGSRREVLVFPTRMGGRKRKLIHYVAETMNLAHWGQGKKVSEKTVAVARRKEQRRETT